MTEEQRLVAQLFRMIATLENDNNQPKIQEIQGVLGSLWEKLTRDDV